MAPGNRLRRMFPLFAALLALSAPSYANYTFNRLDLWGYMDLHMRPVAINNAGQIAVQHPIDDMASHIINWQTGQPPTRTFPSLNYNAPPGPLWFSLTDINNTGNVAGYTVSGESACMYCSNPFTTQGTSFKEFAPPNTGGFSYALNDKGQAVGALYDADVFGSPRIPVFVDSNGSITYLNALSYASDLNNAGMVVGERAVGSNKQAATWQDGSIQLLGTLGGNNSFAEAINESNQIVGQAQTADGVFHGALWDQGTVVNLGMHTAVAINERGEVVGSAFDGQGKEVAALWRNGVLTDLNTFLPAQFKNQGWSLISAIDINDKGWIVGLADDGNANYLPFLMTSAVPEPQACLILLLGLGLIGLTYRRTASFPRLV